MPSLTQPAPKKRRHDDHDANGEYHLLYADSYTGYLFSSADKPPSSPQDFHHDFYQQHHHGGPHPRKIIQISSPLAKKMRMSTERPGGEEQRQTALAPTSRHNHSRSPSAAKAAPRAPMTTSPPNNLLGPCHICHRKPTKKNELDSYADCEGCGERTCYVCIRECLGWKTTGHADRFDREVLMRDQDHRDEEEQERQQQHEQYEGTGQNRLDQSFSMEDVPSEDNQQQDLQRNESEADQDPTKRGGTWGDGNRGHRGRICSQCCVENGPEGEVICLGCLES